MTEPTKKCRFCGEEILEVAVKCKHCGSMLDGSDKEKKVTVEGIDPMAELHTPIKGKSKGKLTFIGKLGILIGILCIVAAIASMGSATYEFEFQNLMIMVLIGLGFIIGSYLWARRPPKKKD